MNVHLFGKNLFIRFTMRVLCGRLSVSELASFPFGLEDGMWDLILFDPLFNFTFSSTTFPIIIFELKVVICGKYINLNKFTKN